MVTWKLLTFLVLLALLKTGATLVDRNLALNFGKTIDDYVKFDPDMHPVKDMISICAWVKKQSSNPYSSWLNYFTSHNYMAIIIDDIGLHNIILGGTTVDLRSSVTVPMNTWTHYCMTGSTTSNTNRVYYNGTLVGSKKIASKSITLGGSVLLGHYIGSGSTTYVFGGQLFKLNMFAKELTGEEIKEMWESGMCSEVEENYGRARYLKWEDILLEPRQGNVREVETRCYKEEREATPWDFLYSEPFFNNIFTDQLLGDLPTQWDILGTICYFYYKLRVVDICYTNFRYLLLILISNSSKSGETLKYATLKHLTTH